MSFDPRSLLQRNTLFSAAVDDIIKNYSPASQPVLRKLIEGFSSAVYKEAGIPYDSSTPLTEEQNKILEQAQGRLLSKSLGNRLEPYRQSLLQEATARAKGISDLPQAFKKAGLWYEDYQILDSLKGNKTYKDLLDTVVGALQRPIAKIADRHGKDMPLDALQSGVLGVVENIGKYSPARYGKSNAGDLFLLEKALYSITGYNDKNERFIDFGSYNIKNPVKAAGSILKEYTKMTGNPSEQLLAKFGYTSADLQDPNVAKYIVSKQADIFQYSATGSGLFPGDQEGIIYTRDRNLETAQRIGGAVGKIGLPTGVYSSTGSAFDEQGNLVNVFGYKYGYQKFKNGMQAPPGAFLGEGKAKFKRFDSASGYYLEGQDTLKGLHFKGRTSETKQYMPSDLQVSEHNAIKSGRLKQVFLNENDISRLIEMDRSALAEPQQRIYDRLMGFVKQASYNLAGGSSPTDDLDIDQQWRGLDKDVMSVAPTSPVQRDLGDTSDMEFRKNYLVPWRGHGKLSGVSDTEPTKYLDTETGELVPAYKYNQLATQWRQKTGGVWRDSGVDTPGSAFIGAPPDKTDLMTDFEKTQYELEDARNKYLKWESLVKDKRSRIGYLGARNSDWGNRFWSTYRGIKNNYLRLQRRMEGLDDYPALLDDEDQLRAGISPLRNIEGRLVQGGREIISPHEELASEGWGSQVDTNYWQLASRYQGLQKRVNARVQALGKMYEENAPLENLIKEEFTLSDLLRQEEMTEKALLKSETGSYAYDVPTATSDSEQRDLYADEEMVKSMRKLTGEPEPRLESVQIGTRKLSNEELQQLAQEDPDFYQAVQSYQRGREIINSKEFDKYSPSLQEKMLKKFDTLSSIVGSWVKKNRNQPVMGMHEVQDEYQGVDKPLVHIAGKLANKGKIHRGDFVSDPNYYRTTAALERADKTLESVSMPAPQKPMMDDPMLSVPKMSRGRQPTILAPIETNFGGGRMITAGSSGIEFQHTNRPAPNNVEMAQPPRPLDPRNPAKMYEGLDFLAQNQILKIAENDPGNLLIYGMAGTGKTQTLSEIVKADVGRGLNPNNMLFLTGTTVAHEVFEGRMQSLDVNDLHAETFHKLGFSALKSLAGRYGVPGDFSGHNVLSAAGHYGEVMKIMDRMPGTPEKINQAGEYNYGYGDYTWKYHNAIESFKSLMMDERYFGTPEFMDWAKKKNVDPQIFQQVYNEMQNYLQSNELYSLSDLVAEPARIVQQAGNQKAQNRVALEAYGQVSGLYLDEVSMIGKAARTMTEQIIRANPQARIAMVGDPIQSKLWEFIGGGPENPERLAELANARKMVLKDQYRLPQGALDLVARKFHMPNELRPTLVDERGNSIPKQGTASERIANFLKDTHVAASPTDKFNLLTQKIKGWQEKGVQNKDMLVMASTKAELDEMKEYLESQGIEAQIKPHEELYKHNMAYPPELDAGLPEEQQQHMTPGEVAARVELDKRNMSDEKVTLATPHAMTGSEATHVAVSVSKSDLERMQDYAGETLISSAVTRAKRGGEFTVLSSLTSSDENYQGVGGSGGLPSLLEREVTPQFTPDAQRIANTKPLRKAQRQPGDIRQEMQRRVKNTPLSDVGNRALEESAREVVLAAVNDSLDELTQGGVRTSNPEFVKKFQAKVQEKILDFVDTTLNPRAESYPTEVSKVMGALGKLGKSVTGLAIEQTGQVPQGHNSRQMDDYYEYHPFGAGGVPLRPPSGGRGGGQSQSSGWDENSPMFKNPYYRLSRGLWAITMGGRVISQAFGSEITSAKRYTDYLDTFAGIASLEGTYAHSDYSVHSRRMEAERVMSKGAYEQFGSFTTLPAALAESGYDSIPRLVSAGKVSFGILSGSAQAAFGLSFIPGGKTAGAVMLGAGALASAATMGGALAMENYNAKYDPEEKLTYSSLGNNALKGHFIRKAMRMDKEKTGVMGGSFFEQTGYAPADLNIYGGPFGITPLRGQAEEWYWNNAVKENFPNIYWQVEGTEAPLAEEVEEIAQELYEGHGLDMNQTASWARIALSQTMKYRKINKTSMLNFSLAAEKLGMTQQEFWNQHSQVAQNIGLGVGSLHYSRFMFNQATYPEDTEQAWIQDQIAGRYGQYASQIAGYFTTPGMAQGIISNFNVMRQPQASAISSVLSPAAMWNASDEQLGVLSGLASDTAPAIASAIGQIGNIYTSAGIDPSGLMGSMLSSNLSMDDLNLWGKIAGGDLEALSYASWQGAQGGTFAPLSGWENRFFDQLGFPIYQKSGTNFLNFLSANGVTGLGGSPAVSSAQAFQNFFGHSHMPQGYYQAWADGGLSGAQSFMQSQMADLQMASAGIALKQLNLNRQFYWGSGSWDKPAQGSMWWYEDQMRALQHESTMANFASSEAMMSQQHWYSTKSSQLQGQRMEASHDYNRWMMDFQKTMSTLKQGWTREDWAYQDTMRSLSFSWGLEDVNEAIRGTTGRDRRNLIRQRDRMTTQHNLENEQIDTQRDRQEQLWAMEEEQFEKRKEYQETLMELDVETFELNKRHQNTMYALQLEDFERRKQEYEEQRKLSEEMNELQREHQAEQMELQEQSIGLQAASAALQKQMAEDQKIAIEEHLKYLEEAKTLNEYKPAQGNISKLQAVAETLGKVEPAKVDTVIDMIQELQKTLPGTSAIISVVNALNSINISKLYQFSTWLETLP